MVKKHLIGLFLNTGTKEAPVWTRIKKSTELTISMNPETEEFDYIADESPTTELMKYKPSIDQDLTMYEDEPDFKMIWEYFYNMKVGNDARTECMIAFMMRPAEGGGYEAWKTDCVLSVTDLNAVDSKINFQIAFGGTVSKGTATKTGETITFAESAASAAQSTTASSTKSTESK